jgi:hypothetical protein
VSCNSSSSPSRRLSEYPQIFITGNRKIYEVIMFLLCLGPSMEHKKCVTYVNCSLERKRWCISVQICINNHSHSGGKRANGGQRNFGLFGRSFGTTGPAAYRGKPPRKSSTHKQLNATSTSSSSQLTPSQFLMMPQAAPFLRNYIYPGESKGQTNPYAMNVRWQMLERCADRICKLHLDTALQFPEVRTLFKVTIRAY